MARWLPACSAGTSGRPRGPFDLLKLEHESRPLAFRQEVPAGRYCKIRLTLDDLELVFNTGEPNFHPKLPGNNKLDLNPRECFYVAPDSKVYLQLDMDAKSIHVTQTGKKKHYNFRPVVFIDVIQRDFPAKLVRLEDGVIRDINREEGTLLLCEFSYGENARGDSDDCMVVLISRDTSAFDNVDNDGINDVSGGDAISLAELMAEGIIEGVLDNRLRLEADSFPCESGAGVFNVSFNDGTIVYLSTESGGEFVDTGALAPGQEVDISGMCEGTTLAARTIIIRE